MIQDLIILHGALGAAKQFKRLQERLGEQYKVHVLDFNGHGAAENNVPFSIDGFSEQLSTYINSNELNEVKVFGYSMGGYVALNCVAKYPMLIKEIITLGTKFDWSEETAAQEVKLIQPDVIEEKVPKFANYLALIQQPRDWKEVMLNTQSLMLELGAKPLLSKEVLETISIPVEVCWGEKDNMVTLEETQKVASALPNGILKSIPDMPHPIQLIDLESLLALL